MLCSEYNDEMHDNIEIDYYYECSGMLDEGNLQPLAVSKGGPVSNFLTELFL